MARTSLLSIVTVVFYLDTVQLKPQDKNVNDQQGPCVGMDCLHGVLMHNDHTQGEKHTAEDQYLRYKGVLGTSNSRARPPDAEEQMHGVLMHSDSKVKHHDMVNQNTLPDHVSKAGPVDLAQVVHEGMHTEGSVHLKHDWDKEQALGDTKSKGPFGENFMHGVLMHGDENYEHKEGTDEDKSAKLISGKKIGPKDAEEHLHGVLMHGDSEPGVGHSHEESVETKVNANRIGPNNDLHGILMHGDSKVGHDHSEEDEKIEHDVFSDISRIQELGLDKDLLKIIDLQKILEKDRQEYADWIISNPQFQDESMMGSTLADVSDSILQDIELMKKRYLAINNQAVPSEYPAQQIDDNPFTAEDAKAIYDKNIHAEEGEDTRHDLELLGSTEPLNARHKAKLALLKSKLEK